MVAQINKTNAEQEYLDQFEAKATSLPGNSAISDIRRQAIKRFDETGLPDRRVEAWKYTDLRAAYTQSYPLADRAAHLVELNDDDLKTAIGTFNDLECHRLIFVNGSYRFDRLGYPEGVDVKPLQELFEEQPDWIADKLGQLAELSKNDPTLNLNTAFLTDGVKIQISGEADKPIHVVYLNTGKSSAVSVRNFIELEQGAKATVIEQFVTLGDLPFQTNNVTQVITGDNAELHHIMIQSEQGESNHLSTWTTAIGKEASYNAFQLTTGGQLSRNQLFARFEGENANLNFGCTFLGRDRQHSDTTLIVDHAVPNCESREYYKGVMDDNAKGVFQGKLEVKAIAQKTDGKQMAQALLLSETAEFDAKPELEIFADDVVCGHGATSGQLDEDLLFYLKARGIPDKQARALLVQAFIGEALELVEDENIREKLTDIAIEWLEKGK